MNAPARDVQRKAARIQAAARGVGHGFVQVPRELHALVVEAFTPAQARVFMDWVFRAEWKRGHRELDVGECYDGIDTTAERLPGVTKKIVRQTRERALALGIAEFRDARAPLQGSRQGTPAKIVRVRVFREIIWPAAREGTPEGTPPGHHPRRETEEENNNSQKLPDASVTKSVTPRGAPSEAERLAVFANDAHRLKDELESRLGYTFVGWPMSDRERVEQVLGEEIAEHGFDAVLWACVNLARRQIRKGKDPVAFMSFFAFPGALPEGYGLDDEPDPLADRGDGDMVEMGFDYIPWIGWRPQPPVAKGGRA